MHTGRRWRPAYFYPRPPRGGRRAPRSTAARLWNFYPRPPRGGRPRSTKHTAKPAAISIHALREEGDRRRQRTRRRPRTFLSTPSARRATRCTCPEAVAAYEFLSTPSARRATRATNTGTRASPFLSTPSARRATLDYAAKIKHAQFLSTPSARRATSGFSDDAFAYWAFLSTPSARRATHLTRQHLPPAAISIHALREEGDVSPKATVDITKLFLSTPSARRATGPHLRPEILPFRISIHALREEGDAPPSLLLSASRIFLSTPSARRATLHDRRQRERRPISIHALREEGDRWP